MSSFTFRPAVRENTPLIIGIGGPTKSGKTYSAHRLARGLVPPGGGQIVMLNAEGPRGHQYADKFKYLTCELTAPYRPTNYTEALKQAAALKPGCVIIDSTSHMQDGPGGIVEWHTEIALRMAKGNTDIIEKMNAPAWVEPKAMENQFVYQLQAMVCPVILAFRAKEKVKITKEGKWVDLGWQPIASDRVAFETLFTLMLPPHSKGVPDLAISEMREPFDTMIPNGKPIDEDLGRMLAEWARGQAAAAAAALIATLLEEIQATVSSRYPGQAPADKDAKAQLLEKAFGSRSWAVVKAMDELALRAGLEKLRAPVQVSSAQAPDRGAADHTKAPMPPTEAREDAAGTAAPGSTKVSPPNEPAKAGDEPAPGLFPSAQQLKPAPPKPAAAGPQLAGVDVDDESQALVKMIEAEKAKLDRQPSDAQWETVCASITGTTVLDMADPAALQDLLDLVKKLVDKDPESIEKVRGIIAPAATA